MASRLPKPQGYETENGGDTQLLEQMSSNGSGPAVSLSPRELTVLRLTAWGLTNIEIGAALQISVKTVEAHKANGMRKLGVRSRHEVVRFAVQCGWLVVGAAPTVEKDSSPSASPVVRFVKHEGSG